MDMKDCALSMVEIEVLFDNWSANGRCLRL